MISRAPAHFLAQLARLSPRYLDPRYLGTLVRVGMNKNNFKPAVNDIKTLYYQKFHGGGGKGDAELDISWTTSTTIN